MWLLLYLVSLYVTDFKLIGPVYEAALIFVISLDQNIKACMRLMPGCGCLEHSSLVYVIMR